MQLYGIFLLVVVSCTTAEKYSKVENKFECFFISPYITKSPPLELSVTFSLEKLTLGKEIAAYVASVPPYITYDADPDYYYTIIFVDCDYPSVAAPSQSQFLHALLVNIEGNDLSKCNYLTPYYPVSPDPGSGYHRYLILLYKQTRKLDVTTPEMRNRHKNVTNFSVSDFARQYDLGDPLAGNFFLAQHIVCDDDEDTPQICSI